MIDNYFEIIDSVEKAYWLGFIFADGYFLSNDKNKIGIHLTKDDLYHLENFADRIQYDKTKIKHSKEYNNNGSITKPSVTILINNEKMYYDLLKYGMHPRKSLTIKYPINFPEDIILNKAFILGYFDGNGTVSGSIRIFSGSKDILIKIKEILNIKSNICKDKSCFILSLNTTILQDLLSVYPDSLIRKREKFESSQNIRDENKKLHLENRNNIENERLEKLKAANIDNTKYGWKKKVSEVIGLTHQHVKTWLLKYYPEFWETATHTQHKGR